MQIIHFQFDQKINDYNFKKVYKIHLLSNSNLFTIQQASFQILVFLLNLP
jgi:hypothetical protein